MTVLSLKAAMAMEAERDRLKAELAELDKRISETIDLKEVAEVHDRADEIMRRATKLRRLAFRRSGQIVRQMVRAGRAPE